MHKDDSREAVVLRGGLDEVGMGALAGPIVVAVTVFEEQHPAINGVKDSKKLTKKKREELAPLVMGEAVYLGVGWAGPRMIDEHGVAASWQFAAKQALARIPARTHLIVDGTRKPTQLPPGWRGTISVEKGADNKYWEVAAASIAAKVLRDRDMIDMASKFPAYGWAKNVGYGSQPHYAQLKVYGPSPYHRMSFLKNMIKSGDLPL